MKKFGRLVLWFILVLNFPVQAQITPEILTKSLERIAQQSSLKYPEKTVAFYKIHNNSLAWVSNEGNILKLLEYISNAANLGLSSQDYHLHNLSNLVARLHALPTAEDSLMSDFQFTDAAIHFSLDVANGSVPPEIPYNGLNYHPNCTDIPLVLATAIRTNKFASYLESIEPRSADYRAIKSMIVHFNKIISDTGYKNIRVTSSQANFFNGPLIEKLRQLGFIQHLPAKLSDKDVKEYVKKAQRLFSLIDDGFLRASLLAELNVTVEQRLKELMRALNTVRWLRCIKQNEPNIIVVNIPSATLLLYDHDQVALASKVIVGKPSTRTPIFTSRISEVVLYPYWMVPKSIATKELLPLIKRNPGYIEANNFQVVNHAGKVINPSNINWHELSASNFPYTLRQSTGCDNSLGLVKLDFNSPFSVYLHDTPWKALFDFNKRYFSHGCIRVEKAIELAHAVLRNNTIAIDTLEEKGCLRNQRPIPVPASVKTPLFILYNTAWVDSSATVRFHENVYRKELILTRRVPDPAEISAN